jgi:mRNA interferase MazF
MNTVNNTYTRFIKRGQVYFADLGDGMGSEMSGIRPVIIIQNNMGNKYSSTVTVVPVTSRYKDSNQPTHFLVEAGTANLNKDSVILAESIKTIAKERLKYYVGYLNDNFMEEVSNIVKIQLGLQ